MRTCGKCKVDQEVTEYFASNKRKDRLHLWCKSCCAMNKGIRGGRNLEEFKEAAAAYQRRRRKLETSKEWDRLYRGKYHQSFSGRAAALLSAARNRAKLNDRECDLGTDWVIEHLKNLRCEATGLPLSLDLTEGMQHTWNRPSIDRKDNNKGYLKDNCQIVSIIYNKAKLDGLHEHVLEMCRCLMDKSFTG